MERFVFHGAKVVILGQGTRDWGLVGVRVWIVDSGVSDRNYANVRLLRDRRIYS